MEFKKYIHYNGELESAVLGACLIEHDAFARTFGILEKDYFYYEGNKIVYTAIAEMYNAGLPIDMLTVCDYVMNVKKYEQIVSVDATYYILRLTNDVVSTAHLEYHAHIIHRLWMDRELIRLTHGGIGTDTSVDDRIRVLNQAIQRIKEGSYEDDWVDMSELAFRLMKHQDNMTKTGGVGLATGVPAIDKENGGFFPGQMIVIGARPSVGKSSFMAQMAIDIATKKDAVGIISLEMSNEEIAGRLSAIGTNDDFRTIFRNLYRDENHKSRWYEEMGKLTNLPIYVSDKTGVSSLEIKAKATKLKHKHGLKILFVDYLQLVDGDEDDKRRNRENEVSRISRSCKLMAKELGIPVVLLCQLNRESLRRAQADRFPKLSDLRESGSIEQDADVVMFLHRDSVIGIDTDEDGNSTENQAQLLVRKWRNGSSNLQIDMQFDGPRMRFLLGTGLKVSRSTADQDEENPF